MQPSEMEEECCEERMLAFVVSLLVNPKMPGFLQFVAEIFKYPF